MGTGDVVAKTGKKAYSVGEPARWARKGIATMLGFRKTGSQSRRFFGNRSIRSRPALSRWERILACVLVAGMFLFSMNASIWAQVGLEPRPEGPAPQVQRPPAEPTEVAEAPAPSDSCELNPLELLLTLAVQPVALIARPVIATVGAIVWVPTRDSNLLESSWSGPWVQEPLKSCLATSEGPESAGEAAGN